MRTNRLLSIGSWLLIGISVLGILSVSFMAFGDPQAVHIPDAGYALAVAALSLAKAPQALANPGAASTLWPGFFNIFNRFPTLTDSLFARKEKPDDEPARNRRIKIR